jgi:hypothetical protein
MVWRQMKKERKVHGSNGQSCWPTTLGASNKMMGVGRKEEKRRKIKELDWAQAQLTKTNSFGLFEIFGPGSCWAHYPDIQGPSPRCYAHPKSWASGIKWAISSLSNSYLILCCVNIYLDNLICNLNICVFNYSWKIQKYVYYLFIWFIKNPKIFSLLLINFCDYFLNLSNCKYLFIYLYFVYFYKFYFCFIFLWLVF